MRHPHIGLYAAVCVISALGCSTWLFQIGLEIQAAILPLTITLVFLVGPGGKSAA